MQANWCITTDVGRRRRTEDIWGPAKIIAVERGEGSSPVVTWLSHGGTLIRAAPEHLRMATPLETRTFDVLAHKYVDLGVIPTAAEE